MARSMGAVAAGAEPRTTGLGLSEETVRAAQAGDPAAQAELFRRAWPLVHGLVFRLMARDRETPDLVQEVLVEALASLPKLRNPAAWGYWLRALTINVVRGRLRRRRLQRLLGLVDSDDGGQVADLISPDAPPDVAAELRAVYSAIGRMSADARVALILRRVEGLSVPELAAEMGISESTAKRRLAAAETELQRELSRRSGRT